MEAATRLGGLPALARPTPGFPGGREFEPAAPLRVALGRHHDGQEPNERTNREQSDDPNHGTFLSAC